MRTKVPNVINTAIPQRSTKTCRRASFQHLRPTSRTSLSLYLSYITALRHLPLLPIVLVGTFASAACTPLLSLYENGPVQAQQNVDTTKIIDCCDLPGVLHIFIADVLLE